MPATGQGPGITLRRAIRSDTDTLQIAADVGSDEQFLRCFDIDQVSGVISRSQNRYLEG